MSINMCFLELSDVFKGNEERYDQLASKEGNC